MHLIVSGHWRKSTNETDILSELLSVFYTYKPSSYLTISSTRQPKNVWNISWLIVHAPEAFQKIFSWWLGLRNWKDLLLSMSKHLLPNSDITVHWKRIHMWRRTGWLSSSGEFPIGTRNSPGGFLTAGLVPNTSFLLSRFYWGGMGCVATIYQLRC
jgi:hypothetical protein